MTIVSRVVFWYRLIVSTQTHSEPGPYAPNPHDYETANGQPSPPSTCSNTIGRGVKPVSFQIGVFDVEDEDQRLLVKGVLMREVRKLEGIVDKLKILGEEYTREDGQQSSNWYGVLGHKMQAEVQDTLRQIAESGTIDAS